MPGPELPKGIYTPLPTFFHEDESLDLTALEQHVIFTASAGTIPVLAGSMGEAVHLSPSERQQMIRTTRQALDSAGLKETPIVSGVGAMSTRETIALANQAADAGADFVMAIPPGYYAGPLQANGGEALKRFFIDVAEASCVPVIVYNFPAVSGGIDLSSDLILDVVKGSPNICGAKLTCASVGKITRLTAIAHSDAFRKLYPRKDPDQRFEVIDGFIDILLPSISVGAAGAISGLPNFAPRTCVRLWELCCSSDPADVDKARQLQGMVSLADGVAAGVGIAGMKGLLNRKFGYSSLPRRPLLPMSGSLVDELLKNEYIVALLEEEKRLTHGSS